MSIAKVALEAPLYRLFDYLAPDARPADIGRRVTVSFGRRRQVGIIAALASHAEVDAALLKPLLSIDRSLPALPADLLELARFAADYYHYPLGPTLMALLPPALKRTSAARAPAPQAYALTDTGQAQVAALSPRATAQRALAALLMPGPASAEACSAFRPSLRQWLKQGWITPCRLPLPPVAPALEEAPPVLTSGQQQAVEQILAATAGFTVWLLYGITGSGKTEVYLNLIAAMLAQGRQTLVLVPEIHLTPQLTERFQRRFPGAHLISLHSGLSDGERTRGWLECLDGRAQIVLGTRLAAMAPLSELGLIIVDEEHDPSYKQMEGLRYSARDVAVWRAQQRSVPVVLGSATPALESWANGLAGRYRRLDLPERPGVAVLPAIQLVDTRTDRPRQGLTTTLLKALQDNLERGEQSLVFVNRRGYAPTLVCQSCGQVSDCPRCAAHLVLHRHALQGGAPFRLQCHHCGLSLRPPEACPACGSVDLRSGGHGTQRLEETLAERFPNARVQRVDRDTVSRKGSFAEVREAIRAGDVDILVGTQILAKGHDFPKLTLVGVVGSDGALLSADYRAGERLFAQLMQVAGRAGRAEHPGKVLVQTAYPTHPLYQALVAHDYPAYAALALRERQEAEFPPYVRQAILRADGRSSSAAQGFLEAAQSAARSLDAAVTIFDPAPALLSRVANRDRWQLVVQSPSRQHLQAMLRAWRPLLEGLADKSVRWILDVDPLEL